MATLSSLILLDTSIIALTARSHGARLITSDRADFELIASYKAAKSLNLEIW